MKEKKKSSSFFLAMLFIGMGLGFLMGNFMAWTLIGMGIGFLLDSLFVAEKRKINKNFSSISIIFIFLGALFLFIGFTYFVNPVLLNLFKDYLISLCLIIFGLILLAKGLKNE